MWGPHTYTGKIRNISHYTYVFSELDFQTIYNPPLHFTLLSLFIQYCFAEFWNIQPTGLLKQGVKSVICKTNVCNVIFLRILKEFFVSIIGVSLSMPRSLICMTPVRSVNHQGHTCAPVPSAKVKAVCFQGHCQLYNLLLLTSFTYSYALAS